MQRSCHRKYRLLPHSCSDMVVAVARAVAALRVVAKQALVAVKVEGVEAIRVVAVALEMAAAGVEVAR